MAWFICCVWGGQTPQNRCVLNLMMMNLQDVCLDVFPLKWLHYGFLLLDFYFLLDSLGKCYKVPAGLEESGKRKRKGPSKLQDFGSWYSKACKLLSGCYLKRNGWHNCLDDWGVVFSFTVETVDRKLKNGPTYPGNTLCYIKYIFFSKKLL